MAVALHLVFLAQGGNQAACGLVREQGGIRACRVSPRRRVQRVRPLPPEHDAWSYRDVLESYGITQWEHVDALDASSCDARCTLSLIVNVIRTDRFSEGLLLEYLDNGKMLEWMRRLCELDEG